MKIEHLGPAGTAKLRAMMSVFAEAFEDRASYLGEPPSDEYLERLLGSAEFIALAAYDEGVIVGALTAYELRKPERERSEIYIYDLAVSASHRRRRIATSLIEALKPIGRVRGARVLFVQADRGDEPALALYRTLGTGEEPFHFDIAVDADSSAG